MLLVATCLAGIASPSFVAGSLATVHGTYPGRMMANAYRDWKTLHLRLTRYGEPFQPDLWRPARSGAAGMTVHQPGKALAGFTIYTWGTRKRPT